MTALRPYRSKLQPFEAEIAAMRQKRPPTPYREIVKILRDRYGVFVQLSTLANFVKVRSRGRRTTYLFGPPWHRLKDSLHDKSKQPLARALGLEYNGNAQGGKTECRVSRPRGRVTFTPSEHYNLTRLTPEEAAALEMKLNEELKGQS